MSSSGSMSRDTQQVSSKLDWVLESFVVWRKYLVDNPSLCSSYATALGALEREAGILYDDTKLKQGAKLMQVPTAHAGLGALTWDGSRK